MPMLTGHFTLSSFAKFKIRLLGFLILWWAEGDQESREFEWIGTTCTTYFGGTASCVFYRYSTVRKGCLVIWRILVCVLYVPVPPIPRPTRQPPRQPQSKNEYLGDGTSPCSGLLQFSTSPCAENATELDERTSIHSTSCPCQD